MKSTRVGRTGRRMGRAGSPIQKGNLEIMIFHSFARSNYFVQLKYRFSPPPCRGSACEYVRLLPCRRPPLTPRLPPHPLHSTPCSQTTPDQRRKRIFRHPTPNNNRRSFSFRDRKVRICFLNDFFHSFDGFL